MTRRWGKVPEDFGEIAVTIGTCYSTNTFPCQLPESEGLIRSAISRAYYSIFLALRNVLGLDYLKTPEAHRAIVNRLKDMGYPEIADKVSMLRRKRNDADYDTEKKVTPQLLAHVIATFQDLQTKLAKLTHHIN